MSSRFTLHKTKIEGLIVAERQPIGDERGFLERVFCNEDMKAAGVFKTLKQINRTLTRQKGTLRGMHFQRAPYEELKIVSCLKGEVFDVVIDLREASDTFGEWHGETLSQSNGRSLVIPEGFAHGFQALTDDCELLYFHTEAHQAEVESGVNPFDPDLAIDWPIETTRLSERDKALPFFQNISKV